MLHAASLTGLAFVFHVDFETLLLCFSAVGLRSVSDICGTKLRDCEARPLGSFCG